MFQVLLVFPYENPEYSCIVVVNKPNKKIGYYGGEVAAPVFKEIAEKLYSKTPKDVIMTSKDPLHRFSKNYKRVELKKIMILLFLILLECLQWTQL